MPDYLPRATESVPAIVSFIEELVATGHAYPAGGDVYFRVSSFPDYGRLSGQKPDQVEQGEEAEPTKEDPRDFALWKANKPATEEHVVGGRRGARGRPGWHIECSAMAEEIYGPAFEIHGGGLRPRLSPPRERGSRSRARSDTRSRRSGRTTDAPAHRREDSKSSGRFETIREVLDKWGRETILVFFLTARAQADRLLGTDDEGATARLETLRNACTRDPAEHDENGWQAFVDALNDDFDTPACTRRAARLGLARAARAAARGLAVLRAGVACGASRGAGGRSSNWRPSPQGED